MSCLKSTHKDHLRNFQPRNTKKVQNSQSQMKFTGSKENENRDEKATNFQLLRFRLLTLLIKLMTLVMNFKSRT